MEYMENLNKIKKQSIRCKFHDGQASSPMVSALVPVVILISPPSTPSTPIEALSLWMKMNYMQPLGVTEQAVGVAYVVFAFCTTLFLCAIKVVVIGPVAGLLLAMGNIGVIIALFSAYIAWSVYTVFETNQIDAALKFVFLLALPIILELWLALWKCSC